MCRSATIQSDEQGSHGRVYYGNRFTTLIRLKQEIGPELLTNLALLTKTLRDLGLTKDDLR